MAKPMLTRGVIVAATGIAIFVLAKSGVMVPPALADNIIEVLAFVAPLVWAAWVAPGVGAGDRPSNKADTPADQD